MASKQSLSPLKDRELFFSVNHFTLEIAQEGKKEPLTSRLNRALLIFLEVDRGPSTCICFRS